MKDHVLAYEKMRASLELRRDIVGVKFLKNKDEYDLSTAKAVREKMPYCVMIRLVSQGNSYKVNLDHSGCKGATRALGMELPSKEFHSGEEYYSFNLYDSMGVAKQFADDMIFVKDKIYGVEARPLNEFEEEPDVVIMITNPYNAMRITQGYANKFSHNNNFRISGNQAVCSECTAAPFVKNEMNFSMMCAGTRYLAGWEEEELGIGFSLEKFKEVADGVFNSINGAETNTKKETIKDKLQNFEGQVPKIEKDAAYFISEE